MFSWLLALTLVAGTLGAWWLIVRTEYEMREDLLGRTRLAAKTVSPARVRALKSSEADLESADYRQLKEHLMAIRAADPNCRFIYLLGRKADGSLFFFVDSEQVNSKDYSPPGQAYDEATAEDLHVFDAKTASVVGPASDHWGTWISALVPLIDPQNGKVLAVLGMDVDARDWNWKVAARVAWPVGVMLLMMIGLLTALSAAGRVSASPKPVMRRLLPFLTVMFLTLVAGSALLLWRQHYNRVIARTALVSGEVERSMKTALEQQARGMSIAAQSIALDPRVREALKAKDAERLLSDWRNLFEKLSREQSLTHFLFYDANRVCLLRVHKPELHGDQINSFLIREAERTGKSAWGIEMGAVGTATLRIVQPVFSGRRLVGYVEIGKGLEGILRELQMPAELKIAVSIRKDMIRREAWEAGMRLLGREASWERLPHSVIIYASQGHLPNAFARLADHDPAGDHHNATGRSITDGGRNWKVTVSPFTDASGKEIGDLFIVNDITDLKAAFNRDITLGGIAGALVLFMLLGLSFVVLRRTDAGICAQQAELSKNEEHLSAILRSIGDGVIACDTAGMVESLNEAAELLTGWTSREAAGRPVREIFRIINAHTRETAENPVFRAISEGVNVDLANHTALIAKDGTEHQIADSCAPIKDASGAVIGAVLVFRDVTEEYRRREELRESEARFKQLAAQSRTITWEVNEEGLYTFVSQVVKEILGYDPEELVGRLHFYDLHPEEEEREAFKSEIFEVFARKEPFRDLVKSIRCKNGEIRWFSINGIPLLNPDGTLRGYRCSETDITLRKQMEAELESERLRLAGIIEGTHVGTWEWNVQTGETVFNERWAEIIGYTLEEISPTSIETWMKYVHPDDLKQSGEQLEKHFRGELDYYDFEARMMHKSGEWIWVLDRGKVISWTRDGKPLLMLGTHQDITERKRTEEALKDSERKLASAVDIAKLGYWELDMDSGIFTFSDSFYAIFRTTAEAVGGYRMSVADYASHFVHPEDARMVGEETRKALEADNPDLSHYLEHRMLYDDGSIGYIAVRYFIVKDSTGKTVKTYGANQDITERRRTEEALLKANERFTLAVDGSNDGIWDWDIASNEVYLSPRWKQMLGYEDHELANHVDTFLRLVYDEDIEKVNESIRRYLEGELKEYAIQFRMKHKDGSLRWVLSRGAAIRDKNNRAFRMAGSQSDITEQKNAEAAIKAAKEQAEAASKAKSEFLANMSHEIRTPLNGVIGFTDLLRNTALSPEQHLYVENANVSGHALLNIITDILDFSKIEAGMMTLEIIKTDMFLLFEQSVDIVKFAAEKKKLEILLDIDNTMPRFAMVDPIRLNQVLINLLGNAVKFTEKGEVELKVRYKPLNHLRGTFSVSVRDTGIGISEAQKDKLFKAFSQADASTTRKFGGTGLGLIISDMVVKKMGGKIRVESVEGKGSTFFFDLTVDTEHGEARGYEDISHIKRCLIIDDNANNRLILEHMLANWDIFCESCGDGLTALKVLKKSKPFDVIICDYNMPPIDGLETIRLIREKLKLTPEKQPMILLYSSSDDPDVHKKCDKLGVRFCIAKPVKQEQLFACFAAAYEPASGESAADRENAATATDAAPENAEPGPVILVAEDVQVNMMLTKVMLSKLFPCAVILEAENGKTAIRKYREFSPDLVLMDVQMPDMDGLDATKEIRELERASGRHVPIIALTAAAMKEEMEKCYQAGMDDFITKPVDAKKLKTILDKYSPRGPNAAAEEKQPGRLP